MFKRGVFLDTVAGGAVLYYHYGKFHILHELIASFVRILTWPQWTLRLDMAMARRGLVGILLAGVLGGLLFRILLVHKLGSVG